MGTQSGPQSPDHPSLSPCRVGPGSESPGRGVVGSFPRVYGGGCKTSVPINQGLTDSLIGPSAPSGFLSQNRCKTPTRSCLPLRRRGHGPLTLFIRSGVSSHTLEERDWGPSGEGVEVRRP